MYYVFISLNHSSRGGMVGDTSEPAPFRAIQYPMDHQFHHPCTVITAISVLTPSTTPPPSPDGCQTRTPPATGDFKFAVWKAAALCARVLFVRLLGERLHAGR
eukprot:4284522-Prymnesium_polylepis.1